ncbi:hypothetical protein, partial [Photobacterium carnosum]|uniref:hypothetical protein n=1 Tax=Photobacterium carnosum TaxID=2023717 RepID=UPI001E5F91AD
VENGNDRVGYYPSSRKGVRAIRDLLITCLSIKDTNKKSVKTAVKIIILQGSDLARNFTLENDSRGVKLRPVDYLVGVYYQRILKFSL